MLNLDIAKDELMALCDGGKVDYMKLESMVLESIGDGTASRRQSRISSPVSRSGVPTPSRRDDGQEQERVEHGSSPTKQRLLVGNR